jgi:predicted nuclease with TOPRIM domain
MQLKEQYLQQAVAEVEDLAERVAVLKARIAKQKVNVKLQHQWELDYLRNRFAEFKGRIEELENASEADLEQAHRACELAWKDVQHGVDTLLSALP